MSNEFVIEKGDEVEIYSQALGFLWGFVDYVPKQSGEAWIIRTRDGVIVYVYTCEYIQLVEKGDGNES